MIFTKKFRVNHLYIVEKVFSGADKCTRNVLKVCPSIQWPLHGWRYTNSVHLQVQEKVSFLKCNLYEKLQKGSFLKAKPIARLTRHQSKHGTNVWVKYTV